MYSSVAKKTCSLLGNLALCIVVATIAPVGVAVAQTFDSTSNETDGALEPTCPKGETPCEIIFDPSALGLDPDGDNVFHFTTITIPTDVTLRLRADKLNCAPVWWLASGAVQIDGVVNLSGESGHAWDAPSADRFPSMPGPGGFPGGTGSPATLAGFGPGGGPIGTWGRGGSHASQSFGGLPPYGNPFLLPLIGGSGGAGGSSASLSSAGGGAGGGALLIASSEAISIDGELKADGGAGGDGASQSSSQRGGGGAGGAVRLLAPSVMGSGLVQVQRGPTTGPSLGGWGRIRLETFDNEFAGVLNAGAGSLRQVTLSPNAVFLPTETSNPIGFIQATSVAVLPLPEVPTGSFSTPDVTINDAEPVTVEIEASNIPVGPPADPLVTLYVFNETDGLQIIDTDEEGAPLTLFGTQEMSSTMRDVVFSSGFSWILVTATWDP